MKGRFQTLVLSGPKEGAREGFRPPFFPLYSDAKERVSESDTFLLSCLYLRNSVCCIHCQVVSIIFIGVGSWAHSEKDKYNTLDSLSFDPSVLLIVTGVFLFLVAFCGCIGALRENNILLKIVSDKYSCHPSFSWMTKVQIANKIGVLC